MTTPDPTAIVPPDEARARRAATDRLLHLVAVQGGETQAEEWLAAEVVAERHTVEQQCQQIAEARLFHTGLHWCKPFPGSAMDQLYGPKKSPDSRICPTAQALGVES